MAWNEAAVTNDGVKLLSECMIEGDVIITRAAAGEQYSDPISLIAQKDISAPQHLLNIAYINTDDGKITVNVRIQNIDADMTYTIKQIGIFAKSNKSEEVLLAVIQDKNGEVIPSQEENPEYLSEFDFVIPVSNSGNITVNIDSKIFATIEDVNKAVEKVEQSADEIKRQIAAGDGVAASTLGGKTADEFAPAEHTHTIVNGHTVEADVPANAKFTDTTYSVMTAATASVSGKSGLVPAPAAGKQTSYLRGDGTWSTPTNTTYSAATQSANGLMSAADKKKLDEVDMSAKMDKANPTGTGAFSIGRLSGTTVGTNSFAMGSNVTASGGWSTATGASTIASGNCSFAEGGWVTPADGENAVYNTASAYAAHASGSSTTASGNSSFSEGKKTVASGSCSHAAGYGTTASGDYSHAAGYGTTASGKGSFATGYYSTASGDYSHAEGNETIASGSFSHAEGGCYSSVVDTNGQIIYNTASGYASHVEGTNSIASGDVSHAEGYRTTASTNASHAAGYMTQTGGASCQMTIGHCNTISTTSGSWSNTNGDAFIVGNGIRSSTGTVTRSNAFRVTFKGATYGLSAFNTSGADYAEFIKPWWDDNPDSKDRVGYFVTIKDGKLRFAEPNDYIVGITSGNPSVVGNGDEDWLGRWQRDEFNRIVMEDVEEEIRKIDDETGGVTYEKTGNILKNARPAANPDYDPTQPYIERKDRPEWDYVGMIGVLPLRDDGTCVSGGFAKCSSGGIATAADEWECHRTFFVIERINDHIISVELR